MRRISAIIVVLAALLGGGQAHADDWLDCAATALPGSAIDACNRLLRSGAVTDKQNLAIVHFNMAAAESRKGAYDRAISEYDKAIALAPGDARFFNGRGVAHALKSEFDAAIADYGRAIARDPAFAEALNNRADAYRQTGDAGRAIADLDKAIAADPAFPEAFYTRGEVHLDQGDLAAAKADVARALELDTAGVNRAYGESLLAEIARRAATRPTPAPAAGAERRVALVIGNATYQAVAGLNNPAHDAETIAAALRRTGFTLVTVVHDADRAAFVKALQDFADQADTADWAVVYYAGHGVEIGGVNYLIPVDAKLETDRDVPDEAITLDRVMAAIEGARKLRLVILDACRNNPFLARMKVTAASRAIGRGLARVEPSQATLVAYSARAGTIASDGDSANSPFAAALAQRITQAGVEINKVFRFVRSDVLAATGNKQEPFLYGSLPPEDFYFVPPK